MSNIQAGIRSFTLGPLGNNSYLVWDETSGEAAVIDPSFDPEPIRAFLEEKNLRLVFILLTHAHFDHIAGVGELYAQSSPRPRVGIHPLELPLWQRKGAAGEFGFDLENLPTPDLLIPDGQEIQLGEITIKAVFTPGHTPGHLVYSIPASRVVFTGDLIFFRGVGRTDMIGGDPDDLFHSIDERILSLPPETRLLSGHGPETTVGDEKIHNPFI